jgi:predicted metal-dependent hydrolase
MPPKKRNAEDLRSLTEPRLTDVQREHFLRGIGLFNSGKHWHAHESWEAAWLLMGDDTADDAEIFIRALIQVASGVHLKRSGRYKGARNHLEKALPKLRLAPAWFMGIDVAGVRLFAEHQLRNFESTIAFTLRVRPSGE